MINDGSESLMETVFSVGIVVAMVALVAWRRYKEGQGKPASGKRAVSAGTGKRPVMQRPAEREPVEKREPMPSQKKKRNTRPAFHEPEAVPSASRKAEPEDAEIRLKTPADARKAFLYSEIFRRKY